MVSYSKGNIHQKITYKGKIYTNGLKCGTLIKNWSAMKTDAILFDLKVINS